MGCQPLQTYTSQSLILISRKVDLSKKISKLGDPPYVGLSASCTEVSSDNLVSRIIQIPERLLAERLRGLGIVDFSSFNE